MADDGTPIATEFDPTTHALFNGLKSLGVTEQELASDMDFLHDLFRQVTTTDLALSHTAEETTRVLDCAFLGLAYHRRMPFQIGDENEFKVSIPERADNDYIFTLTAISNALVRQGVANNVQIVMAASEGALLGRSHMPDMEEGNADPLVWELRKHFLALCTMGMIIHRLMPHSKTPPNRQGIHGQ